MPARWQIVDNARIKRSMKALARPPLRTLPEQIAAQLAQEIVEQSLKPGERLKELELCEQFRVSRAPIREALRLLESRGLVQIAARRGVRVTQLSAQEVDELYEIRASLLGLAARRVATRRDAQFLGAAKSLAQRLRQFVSHPAYGKYFEATYSLSNLIADAAQSPRLSALVHSFSQQVARYTRLSLQTPERRRKSLHNWERLLKALEASQPEAAEVAMRDLVFGSRDTVRAALEKKPGGLRLVD
jgi:DNA-binding GntR family transcriptional regulator